MARVKGAMMARKRRNKTLKLAKGYWGAKSKHFKMANEQVMPESDVYFPSHNRYAYLPWNAILNMYAQQADFHI